MSPALDELEVGPVDVEAIAVRVLKADPDVTAFLEALASVSDAADHVSTELPADLPLPRLRPWHGGGITTDPLGRINRARLNLDAWAAPGDEGKGTAFDLMALGTSALLAIAGTTHPEGVVSDVRVIALPIWTPDEGTDLSRYYSTLEVYAHRRATPAP